MAKLMSKKTRETVLTVAVIILVLLFLFFYVIYPLIAIPGMTARADRARFDDPEFRLPNDPTLFVAAGFTPDTITLTSNDNIFLQLLRFTPANHETPLKGTVILAHPDDTDRTFFLPYLSPLLDSGYAVLLYDQRASGLSGGQYHFAGSYEADDLVEIVAYLNIHGLLFPPVIACGFDLGADAAINASLKDNRVNAVIAVNPYLSSSRWFEAVRVKTGTLWIPFHQIIYFWWYQKTSGYPFGRLGADEIQPVAAPTLVFAGDDLRSSDEWKALQEKSSPDLLKTENLPADNSQLHPALLRALFQIAHN